MSSAPTAGLRDVVAVTSAICLVNGTEGKLSYFGYDIAELVAHSTFEEVVYLLWHGELPTQEQLAVHCQELDHERALPPPVLDLLAAFPAQAAPMAVLRTAVSALALFDAEAADMSRAANMRKAVRLTARIPSIVAAFDRLRQGQAPLAPRPGLLGAAQFLYQLNGEEASEADAQVLDAALILHADHELNASTFAAREVASTLADMYGAITGAIATLAGPSHGGANEQVMRMLLAIGSSERAPSWIAEALARHERIMGFGHAVYRGEDPRATQLRRLSQEVGLRRGEPEWYAISAVVEEAVREQKGLFPNVDFYSASAYHALGIAVDVFTPVFACSRIAGWTAHVLEQYDHNRLMRPRAEYVGPAPRSYVPIEQR